MIQEYIQYIKKNFLIWTLITLILEIGFIMIFRNILSTIPMIGCISSIFIAMLICMLTFSSLENAFLSFAVITPLLPLSGYMSLMIERVNYQWLFYAAFYAMFALSLIRNKFYERIKKKLSLQNINKFYLIMIVLLILNAVFAYNKTLSFTIFIFGFLPFFIYLFLMSIIEFNTPKNEFIEKVLICVCLGVVLSDVPDFVKFIYGTINNFANVHLTGPLGINFIMAYTLVLYPFILINYQIKKGSTKKIYLYLLIVSSILIATQRSRGLLIGLCVLLVILIIGNRKKYKYYLLIFALVLPCVTYNVYHRPDVAREILKYKSGAELGLTDIISEQSGSRAPIWSAAIGMIKDNPILGVGNGNFKFFLRKYVYSPREYSDAHNFVFTTASEIGPVFAILLLGYLLNIFINCMKKLLKLSKESEKYMKYLALVSGGAAYLAFANSTGAALQNAHEVHSYTPTFIIMFFIYYYKYLMENNGVQHENE